MELKFTERQTPNLEITFRLQETLLRQTTAYQELMVVDTLEYGRMLCLDGTVQTTERDEFVYHEMIAHIPLNAHPNPRRVLIVGGGDGGTLREVTRHPEVAEAVQVEIDEGVVEASRRFLPTLAAGFLDPRVQLIIGDGIKHVRDSEGLYDCIIIDSTDPVGPATGLFSADFYRSCHRALAHDGILVAQSESPFLHGELITSIQAGMRESFPLVHLYLAAVPTYPSGLWSFSVASKVHDPRQFNAERAAALKTKYYGPEVHQGAFLLPPFVRELQSGAGS